MGRRKINKWNSVHAKKNGGEKKARGWWRVGFSSRRYKNTPVKISSLYQSMGWIDWARCRSAYALILSVALVRRKQPRLQFSLGDGGFSDRICPFVFMTQVRISRQNEASRPAFTRLSLSAEVELSNGWASSSFTTDASPPTSIPGSILPPKTKWRRSICVYFPITTTSV